MFFAIAAVRGFTSSQSKDVDVPKLVGKTLVAAKDLEGDGAVTTAEVAEAAPAATDNIEITEAEKQKVNDLLNSLNF